MTTSRVAVSGCFDLLHSGHVAFLTQAAQIGPVTVCLGSDRTVMQLKGRPPVTNERERQYMLAALACVDAVRISRGSGLLDFLPELEDVQPSVFFVNADGDTPLKRDTIEALGITYRVADRVPHEQLPGRSTTHLRTLETMPSRLDLAGGWLDQPFVSQHAAGPVITISLEPDERYERRAGMASSTRQKALGLWGPRLPVEDRLKLAQLLFAYENPPGTQDVAGSQDAIGIVYPGLNRLDYDNAYWPRDITTRMDPDVLDFLQWHLHLVFVESRPGGFEVLSEQNVTPAAAGRLADAADRFWHAALAKDAHAAGQAMTDSFHAQVEMFPLMRSPQVDAVLREVVPHVLGYKISGAGGGGYVVAFADKPIQGALRPSIRREE